MTGFTGPYLSCTRGVWTTQTATAACVSAVDGAASSLRMASGAAPASAPGPDFNGVGAGVTRGGAT